MQIGLENVSICDYYAIAPHVFIHVSHMRQRSLVPEGGHRLFRVNGSYVRRSRGQTARRGQPGLRRRKIEIKLEIKSGEIIDQYRISKGRPIIPIQQKSLACRLGLMELHPMHYAELVTIDKKCSIIQLSTCQIVNRVGRVAEVWFVISLPIARLQPTRL